MWRAVTDAVGTAARDALWDYPDLMPSAEDIDDPAALVGRLQAHARGDAPERDAMDDALDALLAEAAGSTGTQDDASGEAATDPEDGPDDGPDIPRPV
jgi:hypothetical protein